MDRLKDIIIRGGENIDCSEVEAALYTHPAAREVSVFGLPDERLGEVVGAAIWCTDPATPEELSAKAMESLAKFKVGMQKRFEIKAQVVGPPQGTLRTCPGGPVGKTRARSRTNDDQILSKMIVCKVSVSVTGSLM